MRKMIGLASVVALCAGPAMAYEGGAVTGGGSISGTVKLQGAAPAAKAVEITKDKEVCAAHGEIKVEEVVVGAGGGLANAVVSITNITKGKPMEARTPELDQVGCKYVPHVLAFPAGSSVKIKNSDGILHNIHTYSTKNPSVNLAQPKFKKEMQQKFDQPEVIKVTCDAHGWMLGWFISQEHPYYAVTDANGGFKLTDVPAGEYELKVWHEKLGEKTAKVSVAAGGDAKSDFELASK